MVDSLHNLLSKGSFFEQQRFLSKFIEEIEVDYSEVVVKYSFPFGDENGKYLYGTDWLPGLDSNQQPTG